MADTITDKLKRKDRPSSKNIDAHFSPSVRNLCIEDNGKPLRYVDLIDETYKRTDLIPGDAQHPVLLVREKYLEAALSNKKPEAPAPRENAAGELCLTRRGQMLFCVKAIEAAVEDHFHPGTLDRLEVKQIRNPMVMKIYLH